MNTVHQEILDYVKRLPFNNFDFYEKRLVKEQMKMTKGELEDGLKSLIQMGAIFEPRPGRYEITKFKPDEIVNQSKPTGHRMDPIRVKPKVFKAHKTLIKRRLIQGYECQNSKCRRFLRRSWSLRKPSKCPRCGKSTYRNKPALKKATRYVEKPTKFLNWLFEQTPKKSPEWVGQVESRPPLRSRLHKEGVSVLPMTVGIVPSVYGDKLNKLEAVRTLPKHLSRDKFRGSERAKNAAKTSWETRRRNELEKAIRWVTDKRTGKKHPINVKVTQKPNRIKPNSSKLNVKPASFRHPPGWNNWSAGQKAAWTRYTKT